MRIKDLAVPPAPATTGPPVTAVRDFSATISVDEAVRIALRLQPSLGGPAGSLEAQIGVTRRIDSATKPQLLVGAGYNNIQGIAGQHVPAGSLESPTLGLPAGVSPNFTVSSAVVARQLLYDFNMTRNLVRQSEAQERSDRHNLTTAQQNLVASVRSDFFGYVNSLRLVKVDEANVANRQRQLDLAQAQLRIGIGQPSDAITAETFKSQGILILNQARDQAEQDRVQLLQQMGVDPLTPVTPADEQAPGPDNVDAKKLTSDALLTRPEVRAAAEALAAAKFGLGAAKATNLPALYAELGVGANGANFPLKDNTANFGIGIQFPLFDGGFRSGSVKAARGEVTIAQSNLDTAVLQVKADVASATMALESALQRVQIANNESYNAQEAVRVAEGRYSSGIGLFLDVTTAQNLLLTAQTDVAAAKNSLDQARTQLQRATGALLKEIR